MCIAEKDQRDISPSLLLVCPLKSDYHLHRTKRMTCNKHIKHYILDILCLWSLILNETHHIVTGWGECFGSTNIHSVIVSFMKNSDIIFAVILKKKQTMHPRGTNK